MFWQVSRFWRSKGKQQQRLGCQEAVPIVAFLCQLPIFPTFLVLPVESLPWEYGLLWFYWTHAHLSLTPGAAGSVMSCITPHQSEVLCCTVSYIFRPKGTHAVFHTISPSKRTEC